MISAMLMKPKLRLIGNQALIDLKNRGTNKKDAIKQMVLARHQQWMQMKGGYNTAVTGTLMLFDFSQSTIHWCQPVKKYTPILIWREHGTEQRAIGSREVYVVNRVGVFFWTVLAIMIFAGFIVWQSKKPRDDMRHDGSALGMLRDADGYLSLSRVQVASWTLAIGGMVTGYGLTRLTIPIVPDSLIALMSLSLGTAGISHYKMQKPADKAATDGKAASSRNEYAVSDLICVIDANGGRELSIAQTQMLFWTVMMLFLFISKSAMSGELWEVPWEMVALMGMSQAGYLAPKLQPKSDRVIETQKKQKPTGS